MKLLYRQRGALLVPALIVLIIIVLLLMWQAGLFSGGPASTASSTPSSASQTETADPAQGDAQTKGASALDGATEAGVTEAPAANLPDRELTAGEQAAKRVAEFKSQAGNTPPPTQFEMSETSVAATETGQGANAAAIDQAAALLLTNHAPDFSSCRSATDLEKALECAAGVQTQALNSAFEEHNRLRAAGDEISVQRGGEIMQRVIEGMQRALTPFVDAANRS